MSENIETRDGAELTTRDGTAINIRPAGTPKGFVELKAAGAEKGSRSRRLLLQRGMIAALRDDVGGKCMVYTHLSALPEVQVIGEYAPLEAAIWGEGTEDDEFTMLPPDVTTTS